MGEPSRLATLTRCLSQMSSDGGWASTHAALRGAAGTSIGFIKGSLSPQGWQSCPPRLATMHALVVRWTGPGARPTQLHFTEEAGFRCPSHDEVLAAGRGRKGRLRRQLVSGRVVGA